MKLDEIENFVTFIGTLATYDEEGQWFTQESYQMAIKATQEFLDDYLEDNKYKDK